MLIAVLALLICMWAPSALSPASLVHAATDVNQVYAVVNNGVITRQEFEDRYREALSNYLGTNAEPPSPATFAKRVLDIMVTEKLQLQVAARLSIRVSDEELQQSINNIAEASNLSVEQLQNELARRDINFPLFRERVRHQLIIDKLIVREIRNRVQVSDEEIANHLRGRVRDNFRGREVDIGHIVVLLSETPSATELRQQRGIIDKLLRRLDSGESFGKLATQHRSGPSNQRPWIGDRMGWVQAETLPEFVLLALTEMKRGEHSRVLRGPRGFHLIKLHGARGGDEEPQQGQEVHLRYIALNTDAVVDVAIAKRRLQALRQRVWKGEDFAALAREHSEDYLSREQGGDLGWVNVATLPPQYAEATATLTPRQLSEPFALGERVLLVQLLARRAIVSDDEMRKLRARQELILHKTREQHARWLRQLRGRASIRYNQMEPPPSVSLSSQALPTPATDLSEFLE